MLQLYLRGTKLFKSATTPIASDALLKANEIRDTIKYVKQPLKLRKAHWLVFQELLSLLEVPLLEE